jgi:hypothetical protein
MMLAFSIGFPRTSVYAVLEITVHVTEEETQNNEKAKYS